MFDLGTERVQERYDLCISVYIFISQSHVCLLDLSNLKDLQRAMIFSFWDCATKSQPYIHDIPCITKNTERFDTSIGCDKAQVKNP